MTLKRENKDTKVTEYYERTSGSWVTDPSFATHYDDKDAAAIKRCMEMKDRNNRITTFVYDTLAV